LATLDTFGSGGPTTGPDVTPWAEQIERMPKRHALDAHHETDHTATHLARPMTTPQILRRADHERRGAVLMKRTPTDQITTRAVLDQSDPLRLDQTHQRRFHLQPGKFSLVDPSHCNLRSVKQRTSIVLHH
jgi:hypothetical protein